MKTSDVYRLFFKPGEVCEIRGFGLRRSNHAWDGFASGIVFGYFDNAEAFGKCADALEKAGATGVYFTINPVNPDLIARAYNRLKAADAKAKTTTDKDIVCYRWLPLDIDPGCPAGVSSTDEELMATMELRKQISIFLVKELGFCQGLPATSGNGSHMCYRLPDLPATDENKEKLKKVLGFLADRFPMPNGGGVDLKVFNPSRIWKVYGTTARKGDAIPSRPHRLSYVEPGWLGKVEAEKPGDQHVCLLTGGGVYEANDTKFEKSNI